MQIRSFLGDSVSIMDMIYRGGTQEDWIFTQLRPQEIKQVQYIQII